MGDVRPVILSGGSGLRLWPLSTKSRPKQFADVIPGRSLFADALHRADAVATAPPIVVTGVDQVGLVSEHLDGGEFDGVHLIVEPGPRNTAPAVIAAALECERDDVLIVLPADHVIGDIGRFSASLETAVDLAVAGHIVAFGVAPTRPDTGYGYIEKGMPVGGGFRIAGFVEKPDAGYADEFMASGNHFWNAGMFVAAASTLIEEARSCCPGILEAVSQARENRGPGHLTSLGTDFLRITPISFDEAIMEQTDRAVVVPIDVGWNDIGSFEALWDASEKDSHGNVVEGDVVLADVSGSYVRAGSRRLALAGLKDMIVVETSEGVLVVPRDRAQDVRLLAQSLNDQP